MSGYHQFSLVTRTAHKPHRCIWCGESIKAGESYEDERSIYDGSHQTHRWHPECLADAQADWADGGDPEFMPWSSPRPEPLAITQENKR
jgi:hypothetical protein